MASKAWSDDEVKILKQYYPIGGVNLCIAKGLNRNHSSIRNKANKLCIYYDFDIWTDDEVEILKKYYPIGGVTLCIEEGLTRGVRGIHRKAYELGLKLDNPPIRWSEEEIELLRTHYPVGGPQFCRDCGLNRNIEAIKKKANLLGICMKTVRKNTTDNKTIKWTDFEIDILKKYYITDGARGCIERGVNKTEKAIRHKVSALQLSSDNNRSKWSDDELGLLYKYYPIEGYDVYKRLNGKTRKAVYNKVNRLGL